MGSTVAVHRPGMPRRNSPSQRDRPDDRVARAGVRLALGIDKELPCSGSPIQTKQGAVTPGPAALTADPAKPGFLPQIYPVAVTPRVAASSSVGMRISPVSASIHAVMPLANGAT